ncbi:MAG TPA: AAA family ATPase, partial [Caldisericia bacterium]|nr:AAA family ATPase [Caldisericia bacterium]
MRLIKRVSYIKNFGVFKDFDWGKSKLDDFKKNNFFYGWNYSGKTTLSRVFASIGKTIENSGEWQIELDDGSKIKEKDSRPINIAIFNRDYVSSNLKDFMINNEGIETIFVLGEKNIQQETALNEILSELNTIKSGHKHLDIIIKESVAKLSKSKTDKARNIKELLSIPGFDVKKLDPIYDEIELSLNQCLLDEENYTKQDNIYRTYGNYSKIDFFMEKPQINYGIDIENLKTILYKIPSINISILDVADGEDIVEWIYKGKQLHQGKTKCLFCGNLLPSDLHVKLENYFTKEYEEMQSTLSDFENHISNQIIEMEKMALPDEMRFLPEFQKSYLDNKNDIINIRDKNIASLKQIRDCIIKKKNAIIEPLTAPLEDLSKDYDLFAENITYLTALLKNNNTQIEQLEHSKKTAKESIIRHQIATWAINNNIPELKEKAESALKEKETLDKKQIDLESKEKSIREELGGISKGASKINEYLELFFGSKKFNVEVVNNRYAIKRDGELAEKLSEGEKTIIAFSHFLVSLDDPQKGGIKDLIIFIDDPISSLDSNHLYMVYCVIYEKFKDCKQLFITTHNMEFFSLLKDTRDFKKRNLYFIELDNSLRSCIKKPPFVFDKFRSEYVYLYWKLRAVKNNCSDWNNEDE